MPKRQKVNFSLDADYTDMLRAMMAHDGWTGTPAAYCARQVRFLLSSDVSDLGRPSMGYVDVSQRVLRRAAADQDELSDWGFRPSETYQQGE